MLRAIDIVCPDYKADIGGKIRTPRDPCGYFCNTADFRNWRAEALQIIKNALIARTDLPEHYIKFLKDSQAQVEAMPESVLSVGEDTRFLAQIARDAHCILYSEPGIDLPPITPPVKPVNPLSEWNDRVFLLAGVGLLAWIFVRHGKR